MAALAPAFLLLPQIPLKWQVPLSLVERIARCDWNRCLSRFPCFKGPRGQRSLTQVSTDSHLLVSAIGALSWRGSPPAIPERTDEVIFKSKPADKGKGGLRLCLTHQQREGMPAGSSALMNINPLSSDARPHLGQIEHQASRAANSTC